MARYKDYDYSDRYGLRGGELGKGKKETKIKKYLE